MAAALPPAHHLDLEGEYDLTRREEIAALFQGVDGDGALVIDFSKVTYIDSTILRELALLRLRSAKRSITLRGASRHVLHVLHVVDFQKIFTILE